MDNHLERQDAGIERLQAGRDQHLSDEQFTELLLGATPASVQEHLLACPQCSEEAKRVSGAIGDFAQQSRLWAERRAASRPMTVRDQQGVLWGLFGTPVRLLHPQAWMAAALTLVLVGGIGLSLHRGHKSSVRTAVATAPDAQPAAVAPATLKADNELLSAIDGELRADDSASASLYGLNASVREGRTRAAKRISN